MQLQRPHYYGWRDWLAAHRGMSWLRVRWGYWRELRWWPVPGRIFRWEGLLPELWYYAKCRLWRRYHVVAARTMPPTWQDSDERLLHVMFAVLEAVIFKEGILGNNAAAEDGDPLDGSSWAWAHKEIRELWHWWTVTRVERHADRDRRLNAWGVLHERDRREYDEAHPGWERTDNPHIARYSLPDEFVEPEDTRAAWAHLSELDEATLDDEDTEMLVRLVRLRGYLWT